MERNSALILRARWLRWRNRLRRLGGYPPIVVDEVGSIPFEPKPRTLFFQLVSSRYERPG